MADTSNINEMMALIEEKAIRTREGSFVKVEDVRRLLDDQKKEAEKEKQSDIPSEMSVEQARARIKKDPEITKHFPKIPREPGKAIPASEPQPSSRT
ncbi:MAG: hypothetical protein EHM23_36110 [Acidobacteria bacterium]|jgi:hypothetical protein|nr:MAG: hypothetical protein EHM23_36110 [Acidobacteriota bacterium]